MVEPKGFTAITSNDLEDVAIRFYKDRFRVLLILYFFAEDIPTDKKKGYTKAFKSEVKIQALDFLIRNPDYLAYELLVLAENDPCIDKAEVKGIVKMIFSNNEPIIRRVEMERFFYGAYEDIDNIVAFLKSIGFIDFESQKRIDGRVANKVYYVSDLAIDRIEKSLSQMPSIQWYFDRCTLLKRFFGEVTGSELKISQYKVEEYKNTLYKTYISEITEKVKEMYQDFYGEKL
ncbi:hypothetical protein [Rufibacter sp. LB8]|uniref:hypothetical protein n=1 Tax=Rufibacter sp. LB8 TaxID=2777781 RepID=UPI00178C209C|nr:hypothetical protein [Rufibacter sp. LB8]